MQTYRVKLSEGHTAQPSQICKGYLSINGKYPAVYTRGGAIKKANSFGGKLEKFGKNFTVNPLKMLQLAESEIHPKIIKEMRERGVYAEFNSGSCSYDGSINAFITYGNVFGDILEDQMGKFEVMRFEQEVLDELESLDALSIYYEYIQVI